MSELHHTFCWIIFQRGGCDKSTMKKSAPPPSILYIYSLPLSCSRYASPLLREPRSVKYVHGIRAYRIYFKSFRSSCFNFLVFPADGAAMRSPVATIRDAPGCAPLGCSPTMSLLLACCCGCCAEELGANNHFQAIPTRSSSERCGAEPSFFLRTFAPSLRRSTVSKVPSIRCFCSNKVPQIIALLNIDSMAMLNLSRTDIFRIQWADPCQVFVRTSAWVFAPLINCFVILQRGIGDREFFTLPTGTPGKASLLGVNLIARICAA